MNEYKVIDCNTCNGSGMVVTYEIVGCTVGEPIKETVSNWCRDCGGLGTIVIDVSKE